MTVLDRLVRAVRRHLRRRDARRCYRLHMTSVLDVAAYLLRHHGPMTTMKLQKLCYYAQGHSLVWDGRPMFSESIQAWANGPVVYELFDAHRGKFDVGDGDIGGNPQALSKDQRETIEAVWDAYGHLTGQELSLLTHQETPWLSTRAGLPVTARSQAPIDLDVMQEFFEATIAAENTASGNG